MGSERGAAALLNALGDEQENVRWFAVESIRKLGSVKSVPRLCELLQRDPSPRVREITASALGEMGHPAAIPALKAALKDSGERVRTRAVASLQALAKDDLERMMIIADALLAQNYSAPAKEVLRKAIADFGKQPANAAQIVEARKKLAGMLKAEKDLAGAAAVYAELDAAAGGDMKVREELVQLWFASGQDSRIPQAMGEWLKSAGARELPGLIDLGIPASARLKENKKPELEGQLLDVLLQAAQRTGDAGIIEKVQKLKGVPPPAPEAPAPPAPQPKP
jgi:HEAT repeat protein